MKYRRNAGPLVAWILIAAVILGAWNVAHGRDRNPNPKPAPAEPQTPAYIKKDKRWYVPVIQTGAAISVIATGVCVYKRFVLDDPCYQPELRPTSADDDRVTPSPPAPGFVAVPKQ